MKNIIHRQSCRICGNKNLTKILDLGSMYLQGLFVKEGYPDPPKRKVPLELMWCNTEENENACGLVQLSKTINPNILYSTYWYRSATNEMMKSHLKDIVDLSLMYITKKYSFPDNLPVNVLDIGCNDCTMLSFYPKSFIKWGVDPSNSIHEAKDPTINKVKDVYPTNILSGRKFFCITSIAMMYDLEDPNAFVRAVRNNLEDDGIWIFEMSYLPSMIEANAFDTICNEHIEYYSLSVIEHLLKQNKMKIIDATLNDTNGGSVQCVAVKEECITYDTNNENLDKLRVLEFERGYDNITVYNNFRTKFINTCSQIRGFIYEELLKGKTFHIYGSSTKGNTLLQACGIDNTKIAFAADRNPEKWGAHTLGTNIEIISEEESRKMKPDYYLVLPWHFKKGILKRERETILNGSNFIFPLPSFDIVTKDNIV